MSRRVQAVVLVAPILLAVGCIVGVLPVGILSIWSKTLHWAHSTNKFSPVTGRAFDFHEMVPGVFLGGQPRNMKDLARIKKQLGVRSALHRSLRTVPCSLHTADCAQCLH